MISKEPCGTKDWSNGCWKCQNRNILHCQIYSNSNSYFKLYQYLTILLFYCIFNQINAALVRIRDFFQTHLIIIIILNFWSPMYCIYFTQTEINSIKMIMQVIHIYILTHGQGLTASLGKKPVSCVVRILPCQDVWLLIALYLPWGDAPPPHCFNKSKTISSQQAVNLI